MGTDLTNSFYARFEARFRGECSAIKERQAFYLPLLEPFKQPDFSPTLLDIGCGRGEWLETAGEAGWQAVGVDSDAGMLEHAEAMGLMVRHGEALEYLKGQPDGSVCLVTAFHLVEHLSITEIGELIGQVHRVLRPGGIMMLETPNPENLMVGACRFYLDPTHKNPLPPDLLTFLAEDGGFTRTGVIRLNETPPEIAPTGSMLGVLYGVSHDYAVVAWKEGGRNGEAEAATALLSQPAGRSLFEAATAFDAVRHDQLSGLNGALANLNGGLASMRNLATQAGQHSGAEAGQLAAQSVQAGLTARLDALEACQQQLHSVYTSSSWRITAPLRRLVELIRKIRCVFSSQIAVGPVQPLPSAETPATEGIAPSAGPGTSSPPPEEPPQESAAEKGEALFVPAEKRIHQELKNAMKGRGDSGNP